MNKAYRLIWSGAKDAWVIAAEIVKGKCGRPSVTRALLAVASVLTLSSAALALPTGSQVLNGTVSMATSGKTLTVTNTPNSIINWQSFSIAAGETTRFVQQNTASAVLNRVGGVDPSSIMGTLQSNGRIFLINPNGIIFGQGSRVDAAGLVASSLNMTDADFLGGRYLFSAGPSAGAVKNQGEITTPAGGHVWLIAPNVENSGIITSPNGTVTLAAGQSIHVVDPDKPEVAVVVSAPADQAVNLGSIVAQGGRIAMYGAIVGQKGTINANSAVRGENGRIYFKSTKGTTLEAGSTTSANGPDGGEIIVQSETGDTLVYGTLSATGSAGKGGTVQLLGNRVGLFGTAAVDASGTTGGGTVLVGGDFQGKNPYIQNATATYVGKDTTIKADATLKGDGGKVIVWADDTTQYYGSITAKGGSEAGNGGFVETSGKQTLDFMGEVDTKAPNGQLGRLLLDPLNIVVSSTGGGATYADVSTFTAQSGTTQTILPLDLDAVGANVTLQATNNITFTSALTLTTTGAGLTAQAGGNININAPVTTYGGAINLTSNDPYSPTSTGTITFGTGGGLWTNGGSTTGANITLTNTGSTTGIAIGGININAGTAGNVTLNSTSAVTQTAPIAAAGLELLGPGSFTLNANNTITKLAGNATGNISVTNSSAGTLTIGTVNTTNGLTSGGAITVNNTGGSIDVANTSATTDISTGSTVNLSTNAINGTISTASGAAITAGSGATLITSLQGSTISIGSGTTITASTGDILIKTQNVASGITLNGGTFNTGSGNKAQFESTDPATSISVAGNVAGNNLVYKTNILGTAAKTTATGSITILPATTGGLVDFGGGGSGVLVLPSGDLSTVFGTPILRIGQSGAGEKAGGVSFNSAISGLQTLSIFSSNAVSQNPTATISATALQVTAPSVTLTENNSGGAIAGTNTGGNFSYTSVNNMSVDTIDGIAGINTVGAYNINLASGAGINQNTGAPVITSGSLNLTAKAPVILTQLTNAASGTLSATLTGTGSLNFVNSTGVSITGITTANQPVTITNNAGNLTVSGNITAGTGDVNLTAPNIIIAGGGTPTVVSGNTVNVTATTPTSGYIQMLASTYSPSISAQGGVKLIADSMSVFTSVSSVAGTVQITNMTTNRPIFLGSPGIGSTCYASTNCLVLSSLPTGTSPILQIGSSSTSPTAEIYVAMNIDRPALSLLGGSSISQSSGILTVPSLAFQAGGAVNLTSANLIGTVAGSTSADSITINNNQSLAIGSLSGPGYSLTGLSSPLSVALALTVGGITDSVATLPAIVAPSLDISAKAGIGTAAIPLKTQVSNIKAVSIPAGDIYVINTGALTTDDTTATQASGTLSLVAKSPLTIGLAGVTAGNGIVLTAGATGAGATTDNLTINGPVTAAAGDITLSAGNSITGTGVVTVFPPHTVTKTANLNSPAVASAGTDIPATLMADSTVVQGINIAVIPTEESDPASKPQSEDADEDAKKEAKAKNDAADQQNKKGEDGLPFCN